MISLSFLTVLVNFRLLLHCLSVSCCYIIINVSRSKCEYFVFSVFDMEVCSFHEMYIVDLMGWMDCVYSLLCKITSVVSSWERCIYYVSFWTIGPTRLLKQRYFSTGPNSCSSLYSMLYNISFLKVVSKERPAAYTVYNSLNWISFKRTDDRDTIYDGCNMIKVLMSLIYKLRLCNLKAFLWSEY